MKQRILTIKAEDKLASGLRLCVHEGKVRHRTGGYSYPPPVGTTLGAAEPGEDVKVEVYPDVLNRIEWRKPGTVPKWLLAALAAPCSCGGKYIDMPLDGSDNIVCSDCGGSWGVPS